jgi:phosphoribosylformylglycinamidine synthase I
MSAEQQVLLPTLLHHDGPKVAVLKADGINCEEETAHAFALAGGQPQIVHINELRLGKEDLSQYQILAIPGGFSYGDDLGSGKVLALELTTHLADEIDHFVRGRGGLVLGICNGAQVLVKMGLLPFGEIGETKATLTDNKSGHFECRWVNLKVEKNSNLPFLKDMPDTITLPVAHGEGRFVTNPQTLQNIEESGLVVMRYIDADNNPTQQYPQNPSGSENAIAAICDPTRRIFESMPHPERYVRREQNPNWRRMPEDAPPQGLQLFQGIVEVAKDM